MENKIKEIEKKLKELSLELEELKKEEVKEEEYIEIPFLSDYCFNIGLIVNKKQTLNYYSQTNTYIVSHNNNNKYKLKVRKTPTPVENLEVGKFYLVHKDDSDLDSIISHITNYKLYLGNGEYVFYNNGFRQDDFIWKYWHEVCLVE